MIKSLGVIIPDYKSSFLEEVLKSALLLNPEKIVVSNFKTSYTTQIENKFKNHQNIRFLNFDDRKNPGDYRNEGVLSCSSKNLLFLDSDVQVNLKTKEYIDKLLENDLDEDVIYWGIYSKFSRGMFSKIQNEILRYRFSRHFFEESIKNNKPYCGQSSHFLISRKTFNKVGGFNPYLRIREDNDFCIRSSIMGVKNNLDENFEADHLKNYNLFSDYFQKPYHAAKVKVVEPNIFNRPNSQIGFKLLLAWIFSPLSFLITVPLFFF